MKTFLRLSLLALTLLTLPTAWGQKYAWQNFAGKLGGPGNVDGRAASARFDTPGGVAVDDGGNVYVSDTESHTIRKITPGGAVTTLAGKAGQAGSTDGPGSSARFNAPRGLAIDGQRNLYVADTNNLSIRKISAAGVVSTVVSGNPYIASGLASGPYAVAVDDTGNLYVAAPATRSFLRISSTGVVTTVSFSDVRSGIVLTANASSGATITDRTESDYEMWALALDREGNVYGTAPSTNNVIKVSTKGDLSIVAHLTAPAGGSCYPNGLVRDDQGNFYVADEFGHTIRKITPEGEVTTLAGTPGVSGFSDGAGSAALFSSPHGMATDGHGNLYVADRGNSAIRKVSTTGVVTTFAGGPRRPGGADGPTSEASFFYPTGVAVDGAGTVFVADVGNSSIRRIKGGMVSTFASSGIVRGPYSLPEMPAPEVDDLMYHSLVSRTTTLAALSVRSMVAVNASGEVYASIEASNGFGGTLNKIDANGVASPFLTLNGASGLNQPRSMVSDDTGNLYLADRLSNAIFKITGDGVVAKLAGNVTGGSVDGTGSGARFNGPTALAIDALGNVYVADTWNHTIRKVTSSGVVTTVAGLAGNPGVADGPVSAARFRSPSGIAVDGNGTLFVADTGNNTIRKITTAGDVTTIGGDARGGRRR